MFHWNVKRWKFSLTQIFISQRDILNIWQRNTWKRTVFVIGSVLCPTIKIPMNYVTSELVPMKMMKKITNKLLTGVFFLRCIHFFYVCWYFIWIKSWIKVYNINLIGVFMCFLQFFRFFVKCMPNVWTCGWIWQ